VILKSSNYNLTSPFRVITQMWLALSLDFYKWYQNLVIPCGIEALHGMDLNKDVRNLSGRNCDTLESLSHIGKMNYSH
jgi:hypothetical protein